MKTNRIGLLLGFLLGTLAAIAIVKPVLAGCLKSCWSRSCASSFGYSALGEDYALTHAEWKPGPGVDCSGLVNKTWTIQNASGSTNFYRWDTWEVIPDGGYTAGGFYYECNYRTNVCHRVCTGGSCPMSSTDYMDAFATLNGPGNDDNHIGLIYQEISDGRDQILEAVSPSVHIEEKTWRTQSSYRGIKRTNITTYTCLCGTCN
jgi:hypothetical protein